LTLLKITVALTSFWDVFDEAKYPQHRTNSEKTGH